MSWIALALFLAAAVGGLIMALRIFRNRKPPLALALAHGAAAAAGLLLIAKIWLDDNAGTFMVAGLGILIVAALGGFVLFSKVHPKALVALHAAIALAGVGALLIGML